MKLTGNKKGFTVVELVVVLAVIAILAAVIIPSISKSVTKNKELENKYEVILLADNALKEDLVAAAGVYGNIPSEMRTEAISTVCMPRRTARAQQSIPLPLRNPARSIPACLRLRRASGPSATRHNTGTIRKRHSAPSGCRAPLSAFNL